MAAVSMNSAQFKSTVLPILSIPDKGLYDQSEKQWSQVIPDYQGLKRRYHQEAMYYGFTAAPLMPEGDPAIYRQGGQLYDVQAQYNNYGLAFAITKNMVEDGEALNFGKTYSEHLMRAMIERIELDGANIFNYSFTNNPQFIAGDAVPLISASHPNADGSTFSNLVTAAALSYTSLQQMLIQIRKGEDATRKKIDLQTESLVVSPENEFEAETIVNSVLQSSNANNGINAIKSLGRIKKIVTLTRLTSSTAYWVTTNAPMGVRRILRRDIDSSMEGDFDTDNMRYKKTMRYIFFWNDPRTAYGNAGA